MTYVHQSDCEELRVIVCFEFVPQAEPEDVAALKAAIIDSSNTLHSVEVAGDFDFMTEVTGPDLGWFNKWWSGLAKQISAVVRRTETSFVCRRFIRRPQDEHALWVPWQNEFKRLEHSSIDKIVAERDYARVYSEGRFWLLHTTMHSLFHRLGDKEFIQLHRSVIVRSAFIDRLVHENGHWIAHLRDGSTERVARSHLTQALKMAHASTADSTLSNAKQLVEASTIR